MIEINMAFEMALNQTARPEPIPEGAPEDQQLEHVRGLLAANQVALARQALLRIPTRSAEWNYLFGAVMLRTGETDEAILYFGLAARQRPDIPTYQTACMSAEAIRNRDRFVPKWGRRFLPKWGKKDR